VASAFVAGVNAFVRLCEQDPALLPPEFGQLGYSPAFWSPVDLVMIRSPGPPVPGHELPSRLRRPGPASGT
jgi:penicillin amidase